MSNVDLTSSGNESQALSTKRSRRRILVVDDNVDGAESLRMILSLQGHEVQIAHDGLAELRVAQGFSPEVILLDIGLPRMDSYEVAGQLTRQPEMKKSATHRPDQLRPGR